MKIDSRKLMAMLLAATMTIASSSVVSFAKPIAGHYQGAPYWPYVRGDDNSDYAFIQEDDGSITTVRWSFDHREKPRGDRYNVIVPKTITGKQVTKIGKNTFHCVTSGKHTMPRGEIHIPEGVIELEKGWCDDSRSGYNPRTLYIPSTVRIVGDLNYYLETVYIRQPKGSFYIDEDRYEDTTFVWDYFGEVSQISTRYNPKLNYIVDDVLNLNNLELTITSEDGFKKNVKYSDFSKYNITVNYANGKKLSTEDNGKPIIITSGDCTYKTQPLTVQAKVDAKKPVLKSDISITEQSYTIGDTAKPLEVKANSTDGNLTYQWFKGDGTKINGETSNTFTPPTDTVGSQDYYCVVTNTNNKATGDKTATTKSNTATIKVISKVHAKQPIIEQDISTTVQSYTIGDTAKPLEVKANSTDGNLSYQWYSSNGSAISGETSSTFTPPTDTVGTQDYYCVVTNTNNSATGNKIATVKSNTVTVKVIEKVHAKSPVIEQDLTTTEQSYTIGDTAKPLEVKANSIDGNLTYQWFSGDGTEITDANSSIFTPPTDTIGTQDYYCVVTNTNSNATGDKVATTKSNTVTVKVIEKVHAKQPIIKQDLTTTEQSYTIGDTAKPLEVKANSTDGTLTYQWFKGDGSIITGATSSTFTPPTDTVGSQDYYCIITNTNSKATGDKTATVRSNTASVKVIEKVHAKQPTIEQDLTTTEQSYTIGDTAKPLEVKANSADGNLTYQWFNGDDSIITGETSSTFTPPTDKIGTQNYYCIITNTNNSATGDKVSTIKSNVITIKVNKKEEPQRLVNAKKPLITKDLDKTSIDTTINKGSIELTIEAKAQDGGILSYQWLKDGKSIDGEIKNTLTIDTLKTGTRYYKCLVTNTLENATGSKTASKTSKTVSVTVEEENNKPTNNTSHSSSHKRHHNITDKPQENTTDKNVVDEVIEIILPNPDSDVTEFSGSENDYIYGKDKDGNIFNVSHSYDKIRRVHIVKILADYYIVKSNVPLETDIENPMGDSDLKVIATGAIDTNTQV